MWEIIKVITSVLNNPSINKMINVVLKKYEKQLHNIVKLRRDLRTFRTTASRILNPNIMRELLRLIPTSEKNVIFNEIAKLDRAGFNKAKSQFNKEMYSGGTTNTWIALSSSWLKQGYYQTTNKQKLLGNLTVYIQPDNYPKRYGPYTYPSVPFEVWQLMARAKGKNGTGAGSVFWKYWLHMWLPSQLRSYVKKRLAQKERKVGGFWYPDRPIAPQEIEIREINKLITRFTTTYYRGGHETTFNPAFRTGSEWYKGRNTAYRYAMEAIRKQYTYTIKKPVIRKELTTWGEIKRQRNKIKKIKRHF